MEREFVGTGICSNEGSSERLKKKKSGGGGEF